MIQSLLLSLSLFLGVVTMFAQTNNTTTNQKAVNDVQKSDSILLSKLGKTKIVLKDGSIKKNCRIKKIHSYWIVYEKDGALHDQQIDKIRRIEIEDGTMRAVFFDDKNKPRIDFYRN